MTLSAEGSAAAVKPQLQAPPRVHKVAGQPFDWASWRRNSLPGQTWNGLYLLIGALCYYATWPADLSATCGSFALPWVAAVFLRNTVLMGAFYLFSHHGLYVARVAPEEAKFNPKWPSQAQHSRDRAATLLSLAIGSAYEVVYMYLLANNKLPVYYSLLDRPLLSLASCVLVVIFRALHFYCVHRLIHPWGFRVAGVDVGEVLYKRYHSFHHKSYNPGPWSGLAMHPVESSLYYTCVLVHWCLPQHPVMFLFNKVHCDLSPIPGHHGFDAYLGHKFHYLHHAKFECNYGGALIPLDAVFGTYRRD